MPFTLEQKTRFVTTSFKCPNCKFKYKESFYKKKLEKSKYCHCYKVCMNCKKKIGISVDFFGDVHVWMKKDEPKS